MDEIIIQHKYTIIEPKSGIKFTDAIVMPIEEYSKLSSMQIDDLKQVRFKNWKKALKLV